MLAAGVPQAELEDFLAGDLAPMTLGFNYYVTSERFLDHRLGLHPHVAHGGNGRHSYVDTETVRVPMPLGSTGWLPRLREAWARYPDVPLAVTEAHIGCTADEQVRWLAGCWQAVDALRAEGADLRAVTVWALFGAVDWCSLLTRREERAAGPDHSVPPHADGSSPASSRAERILDALNILLSDVRYGLGAYLGVYLLTEHAWDEASIGLALSLGGLVGLMAQTPIGLLVDAIRAKRLLLGCAILVVTATCLIIPLAPHFWPVAAAGVVGALAGTTISPTLAAISLGIVGPARFARRAGRNEALFHLGNGGVNLVILATAPLLGTPVLFWMMAATGLTSAAVAMAIPERAIDHAVARGLTPGADRAMARPSTWRLLRDSRPLLVFAGCGALFQMANGSMLALVAQKLALQNIGWGIALTAACAIAAQSVMVPAAALAGARADAWGRRPLLLTAFLALALRGALYTVSDHPAWLIGVQLLEGVGAGPIGALFPVVIADLTRGSGHFAAAQGVVGTVHATGGIVSGALAGMVVVQAGYDAAFLTLASIAAVGAVLFFLAMPETHVAEPVA